MGKDNFDMIESGNWNIAPTYSIQKIARPLIEFDEYRKIARFGTSEMVDEFVVDEITKEQAKIRALERMHESVSMVIDNSIFAIKKKDDKERLTEIMNTIEKMESLLDYSYRTITIDNANTKVKTVKVNREVFYKIFKMLIKCMREIKFILNRSDLIFASYDEFDPNKLKEMWKDELINQG